MKKTNKAQYDYLIVGSGLYGSVFARVATDKGYKVLVIEKRNHIGGNIYTENIEGINVHKYGAHIFHTNNDEVWDFVNRFVEFNDFINSPIANYKGELYPLPFNMNTFKRMWNIDKPEEAKQIIENQKKEITLEPSNLEEQAISLVGKDIYEKLIKGYTEKQWGRKCKDLPTSIIKRIPVRFTFDNNYFDAKYQGVPIKGYTSLIEELLNGIKVELNTDYLKQKEEYRNIAKTIIYTGPIDEYYDYCFGPLEYRRVIFENERLSINDYQSNAVVNYTDFDIPYTRIIEHKWFNFGKDENGNNIEKTIISKEYPAEWKQGQEPYYPINNEKNDTLYKRYKKLSAEDSNVIFGGRLGEYKYYDMDQVIEAALKLCKKIL